MLAIATQVIVLGAFVGALQRFIGFGDVLEFGLGILFLTHIRVVFAGQFAISSLDRGVISRRLHTQNLVIVFEVHRRITIRYRYRTATRSMLVIQVLGFDRSQGL